MSNNPELVDSVKGFLGESNHRRIVNNPAHPKFFFLGGGGVEMTF